MGRNQGKGQREVFVLMLKHTKAQGRSSELTFTLRARQSEIANLERGVVRLRGDLQTEHQLLQSH